MIALTPCDQIAPLRLATLDEILPRQLQRRLDGFGAAADEERMAETFRRMRDKLVGKLFRRLRGEEAGMRIFKLVELRTHRADDFRMRMAETGYRGAAGGIDVVLAGLIANKNAVAGRRRRVAVGNGAMQDVGHLRRSFERGKR